VYLLDTDSGSWINKSPPQLTTHVNAIEVDPRDSDRLWIATDYGVWQSRDAGENWSYFGTGLPNALVEELLFNPAGNVLRAGTRSRGVWEISV
jgi:ligand-binding sensor domain-containing protein